VALNLSWACEPEHLQRFLPEAKKTFPPLLMAWGYLLRRVDRRDIDVSQEKHAGLRKEQAVHAQMRR
ncbi:MAG: hypothetical protein ABI659_03800, partial [Nitrosospira sp.]